MNRFRELLGFKQVILHHVFQKMILQKSNKYSPIYETSLKLFEICIEAIKKQPIQNLEDKNDADSGD